MTPDKIDEEALILTSLNSNSALGLHHHILVRMYVNVDEWMDIN